MFCAECGSKMHPREGGGWVICCQGRGYWYEKQPLPRDNWWPVLTVKGYTFYPTVYWNPKNKPVPPRRDDNETD